MSKPFIFTPKFDSPNDLFKHLLKIIDRLCPIEHGCHCGVQDIIEIDTCTLHSIHPYSHIKRIAEPATDEYTERCYKITCPNPPSYPNTTIMILRIRKIDQYWIPYEIIRRAKTTSNYGIMQVFEKYPNKPCQSSLSNGLEKDIMIVANDFEIEDDGKKVNYEYRAYYNDDEISSCYMTYANNMITRSARWGFVFESVINVFDACWLTVAKFYDCDQLEETATIGNMLTASPDAITMQIEHKFGSRIDLYCAAYIIFPKHHPCAQQHGCWTFNLLKQRLTLSDCLSHTRVFHNNVCKEQSTICYGNASQFDEFNHHNLISRKIVDADDGSYRSESYDNLSRIVNRDIATKHSKLKVTYTYDQ